MSSPTDIHELPPLSPDLLWAQLAGAEAPLMICASSRQAQALQQRYAERQLAAGVSVWPTPRILSFDGFLHELYERGEAELRFSGKPLPARLSEAQAGLLWQICVDEAGMPLLRSGEAAQLAAQAWQLAHVYRLALPFAAAGNADIDNFNRWVARYRQQLSRLGALDAATLESVLLQRLRSGDLQLPGHCVFAGFAQTTPQLVAWLEGLHERGLVLSRLQWPALDAQLRVVCAGDEEQELRAAARWLRERAQADTSAQLAVIVPDLAARRAAVQRVFDEQLCPQLDAPQTHAQPRPYNLSLGEPLARYGLVQAALRLLQLAAGGLEAGGASALLASPYWGREDDAPLRAALDAELRRQGWLQIEAAALLRLSPSPLQAYWRACGALQAQRRMSAALWSEHFAALLDECWWPGPRALDSEEFQLLQRWRELLLDFSRLDRVLGRVDLGAALAQLRELAGRAVFQPQSPPSRLQVLGVLEAQGLRFDAIRVLSLDDERWPAPARPHPFIPHALQRGAGLPHASASREMAYAQAQLDDWRGSCTELVLSYAQQADAREQAPSPLLLPWLDHLQMTAAETLPSAWLAIYRSAQIETLDDAYAPPPSALAVLPGGARVLGDQARCPFRGYALHRLGIRPLETPAYGLQAYDRGQLVHRVLERLWLQWRDQATLLALSEADCSAQVGEAVNAELQRLAQEAPQRLAPVLRELEAQRLQGLIQSWLQVERERGPFTVLRIENRALDTQEQAEDVAEFAGLKLRLRPDRIDADGEGGRIVLDYKTGAAQKVPWSDGRPEDPQLLIYALLEPKVRALAFARLSVDGVGLQGVAADAHQPGLTVYSEDKSTRDAASWDALLGRWRGELQTLAEEIRHGWAAVQPKHPRQSCRDCGLHALCRIRDVVSLDEGEEVAE